MLKLLMAVWIPASLVVGVIIGILLHRLNNGAAEEAAYYRELCADLRQRLSEKQRPRKDVRSEKERREAEREVLCLRRRVSKLKKSMRHRYKPRLPRSRKKSVPRLYYY